MFAIACLTDLFDGKIARKYKLVTNLGKFLDPIADKVLVLSALVIMLTVPQFFTLNFGQWALIAGGCGVALILAREIIVSGFRKCGNHTHTRNRKLVGQIHYALTRGKFIRLTVLVDLPDVRSNWL